MYKNKVFKYLCFQTHLEELQRDLQKIENELKVKEGLWKKKRKIRLTIFCIDFS